mgnify:FL=1
MTTEKPTKTAQKRVFAKPKTGLNIGKQDSFAIGVTKEHYWMITGIAMGRNVGRKIILEEIINAYSKTLNKKD